MTVILFTIILLFNTLILTFTAKYHLILNFKSIHVMERIEIGLNFLSTGLIIGVTLVVLIYLSEVLMMLFLKEKSFYCISFVYTMISLRSIILFVYLFILKGEYDHKFSLIYLSLIILAFILFKALFMKKETLKFAKIFPMYIPISGYLLLEQILNY